MQIRKPVSYQSIVLLALLLIPKPKNVRHVVSVVLDAFYNQQTVSIVLLVTLPISVIRLLKTVLIFVHQVKSMIPLMVWVVDVKLNVKHVKAQSVHAEHVNLHQFTNTFMEPLA